MTIEKLVHLILGTCALVAVISVTAIIAMMAVEVWRLFP